MAQKHQAGDIVLCTVERIEGTNVFVSLDEGGEGSIVMSEVAPGRIRNLREHVVVHKKIVCKILEVRGEHIDLSLRRVTARERKELLEEFKQEQRAKQLFKTLLKEKAEKVRQQITQKEKVIEFLEKSKTNNKELEALVGKDNSEKILESLQKQKNKKTILKREIELKTESMNGVQDIKKILETKEVKITYYAAGKYVLSLESEDVKEALKVLQKVLLTIEERAKKAGATL